MMEAVRASPVRYLGKRRNSSNDELSADLSLFPTEMKWEDGHKKRNTELRSVISYPELHHSDKIGTYMTNEFSDGMGKARKIELENFPPSIQNEPNLKFSFSNEKYLQSQLASLHVEIQLQVEKKDKEISALKSLLHSMTECNQRLAEERNVLSEENNILKVAVRTMDKRQKETSHQVTELTGIISKAQEYIEQIERHNGNLSFLLSSQNRGSNNFDPPPPDVY